MKISRIQPEYIRREQIIKAAFEIIAELGLVNTTIARIAKQAGLSTGIVSHYFGDKQGLIFCCMREMLRLLQQKTQQYKAATTADPKAQLKAIIDANFDISQTSSQAMRIWLDFWSASLHLPQLQRLQRINDQRLHSNLRHHFLQVLAAPEADIAARGLAALIDGLWLRGSLMSHQQDVFDNHLAHQIAYNYLEMQLHSPNGLQENKHDSNT